MTTYRYFADINGQAIELPRVGHDGSVSAAAHHFFGYIDGVKVSATRKIAMKSNPRRHDCDARCFNATGKTMNCECACGGKNHGRGAFNCSAAA
jgi:hypothetical protein